MKFGYGLIGAAIVLLILTSCGDPPVRSSGDTPQRIIAASPAVVEILAGFGLADNLVAAPMNAADIAGIDSSNTMFIDFGTVNFEEILNLEPDLVIMHSNAPFFGASLPQTNINRTVLHELMLDFGIEVVYVEDAVSISEIYEKIEQLGELTGMQREAANMTAGMQAVLSDIENRLTAVTERRRVYFEVPAGSGIYTFGGNTFFNELLTLAGGENIFELERGWFSPNSDSVVLSDPAVIITNAADYSSVYVIKNRPGWWATTAVINEQVHLISPGYTSRPSQNIVRAVEEMAAALYPELFR